MLQFGPGMTASSSPLQQPARTVRVFDVAPAPRDRLRARCRAGVGLADRGSARAGAEAVLELAGRDELPDRRVLVLARRALVRPGAAGRRRRAAGPLARVRLRTHLRVV